MEMKPIPKSKPYMVAIDYSLKQVERLKIFLAVIGEHSIKKFVQEAIENEIDYRLKVMKPEMRALTENVINQRMAEWCNTHNKSG